MSKPEPSKFFLLFLVVVAVFGLALIPLLLFSPNLQADQTPLRRPLISAVYGVICIIGVTAVFYPSKCRMMFKKPNISPDSSKPNSTMQFKGHHPDCEYFSGNRITIRGSVFCAACSGLLIGGIAAMAGVVLFSLGFFSMEIRNFWILAVGEFLMLLGLAQVKMGGYVKMAINALFVVGSFIMLVEADLAGGNLFVDVYVLGLIVFMLWFRILISEWNNKQTCLVCGHCS